MMIRGTLLVCFAAACLMLFGCGSNSESLALVKGRVVTKGGAPYKHKRPGNRPLPPGDPGIRVKFVGSEGGNSAQFFASFDVETSTFDVPGASGKGIPPGKYVVIVSVGAMGEPTVGKSAGPPGSESPSMEGKEVARTEVTVPVEGLQDLTIEVPEK